MEQTKPAVANPPGYPWFFAFLERAMPIIPTTMSSIGMGTVIAAIPQTNEAIAVPFAGCLSGSLF